MAVESETLRLECLKLAVTMCTCPITHNDGTRDPVELAKQFAGFVLGLEYDEANDEWTEPEEDDSELKPAVHAFDEEGQEL
jgi:hypothetical protein